MRMVWDWQALSTIATAVGTLVALGFGVVNAVQANRLHVKGRNEHALSLAMELYKLVLELNDNPRHLGDSTLRQQELERRIVSICAVLRAYGYHPDMDHFFGPKSRAAMQKLVDEIAKSL